MVTEEPSDPNFHLSNDFRLPVNQPGPTNPVLGAIPLADRLITYLDRLASADSSVRRLRAAYTDRLPDVAAPSRLDSTPERIAERERGRER